MRKRTVLGIESTAHTFGIGIVDTKGNILADIRDSFQPEAGRGFVPRELFDHHVKVAKKMLVDALNEAKIKMEKIEAIAFSQGPGIPNALLVGASIARFLSIKFKKPLYGVNHCIAHIEIGKLATNAKDPIVVYTSGGNTQIIGFAEGRYRVFGETEDIAIGNAIDTLAREMGLPPPYGPNFDKVAAKGKWIDMPYVVKGMDVSFSGLLTEAIKRVKEGAKIEDVAYSFMEVSYAMLTEVTERALAHTGKKEVLLVGGVAKSKRLQEMMRIMCEERGAKVFVVPSKWAGDNGVMIAWVGALLLKTGAKPLSVKNSSIKQKWRTDDVDITWL